MRGDFFFFFRWMMILFMEIFGLQIWCVYFLLAFSFCHGRLNREEEIFIPCFGWSSTEWVKILGWFSLFLTSLASLALVEWMFTLPNFGFIFLIHDCFDSKKQIFNMFVFLLWSYEYWKSVLFHWGWQALGDWFSWLLYVVMNFLFCWFLLLLYSQKYIYNY